MAQSDFVIENASGAVVRAEMNTAFEAGVTLSSGGAPPSPTYPNQWWFDTGANILRIRNNANTAWLDAAQKDVNSWNVYTAGILLDDLSLFGPLVGEVRMYGGTAAPAKWYLCNGQALSRGTHANLFSVIGTAYGNGDGVSTFNVPDFEGRVIVGAGQGDTAEGGGPGTVRNRGDVGGTEEITQAENQVGGHGHTFSTSPSDGSFNSSDADGSFVMKSSITSLKGPFNEEAANFRAIGWNQDQNNVQPMSNMTPFGVATPIIYSGV